ncbi:DUF3307 domain-containing protein [Albidovulum sp.]|jgi:hypothetical protein|uniref:DUF3307 domain-containing protein n=1 Tax=Albidovulum sp. TaxID=1872424 RepID=UPI00302DCD39
MTATFAALLVAHVLADFLFQPRWMVARKREPLTFLSHGVVVLILAQAATGQVAAPALLALTFAHMAIDAAKLRFGRGIGGFLADQAAHLATIAATAALAPGLWATGYWASGFWAGAGFTAADALRAAVAAAGFLLATRAGSFAVGLLMAGLSAGAPPEGLPRGGLTIGILERGLIYVLMLAGQPEVIGFLIAAKSILRFGTVNAADPAGNRAASEYIIIGTLASFGWAILVALGVQALAAALP